MEVIKKFFKTKDKTEIVSYDDALIKMFDLYPSPVFIKEPNGTIYQNKSMLGLGLDPLELLQNLQRYTESLYETFTGGKYLQVFFHKVEGPEGERMVVQVLDISKLNPSSKLSLETTGQSFSSLGQSISEEALKVHRLYKAASIGISIKDKISESEKSDKVQLDHKLFKLKTRDILVYLYQVLKEQKTNQKRVEVKVQEKRSRYFVDFFIPNLSMKKELVTEKISIFESGYSSLADILRDFENCFETKCLRASLKNIYLNEDQNGFLLSISFLNETKAFKGFS